MQYVSRRKGVVMTKLDVSLSDLALSVVVAIALIICFSTFNGASAETMSKSKYQALEKNITAEYEAAKTRCVSLAGSEKTVCDSNAEMAKNYLKANLYSSFASTIKQNKGEKIDLLKKDKTVKLDDFNYKNNPLNKLEFENIYLVKA